MRCDSGQACGLGTVGAVFNVMNTIKSQDGGGLYGDFFLQKI